MITTNALRDVTGTSTAAGGLEDMLRSPVDALLKYPLLLFRGSLGLNLPSEMEVDRVPHLTVTILTTCPPDQDMFKISLPPRLSPLDLGFTYLLG